MDSSRKPTSPRQVRFGFNADGSENAAEQATIREMVDRLAKGQRAAAIAADLQARGVATKRGGTWRALTVEKIARESGIHATKKRPSLIEELEAQEKKHGTAWVNEYYDPATGQTDMVVERIDAEDLAKLREQVRIEAEAIRRMTLAERADRVRFWDPEEMMVEERRSRWPGRESHTYVASISEIVKEMTSVTGRSLEGLIDQITGQAAVKGQMRRDVHRLLGEVARLREINLRLRQRLAKGR